MKIFKLLLIFILMLIINSSVSALDLDVEDDLNDFAVVNKLSSNQMQNLKNPFFVEIESAEITEAVETDEVDFPEELAVSEDTSQEEQVVVSEPDIVIDGIIKAANSRIALIVDYNQNKHLLKIGDTMNGYRLSSYQNGEAVFIKNGSTVRVEY